MNAQEETGKVSGAMENMQKPTCREACDQVLEQLEKAHAVAGKVGGSIPISEDCKWPEPDGDAEQLSQKVQDILMSVVALTKKLDNIARII